MSDSDDSFTNSSNPPAHLLGEDLYKNLKKYLEGHLEQLYEDSQRHVDEALLTYYIREWDPLYYSRKVHKSLIPLLESSLGEEGNRRRQEGYL